MAAITACLDAASHTTAAPPTFLRSSGIALARHGRPAREPATWLSSVQRQLDIITPSIIGAARSNLRVYQPQEISQRKSGIGRSSHTESTGAGPTPTSRAAAVPRDADSVLLNAGGSSREWPTVDQIRLLCRSTGTATLYGYNYGMTEYPESRAPIVPFRVEVGDCPIVVNRIQRLRDTPLFSCDIGTESRLQPCEPCRRHYPLEYHNPPLQKTRIGDTRPLSSPFLIHCLRRTQHEVRSPSSPSTLPNGYGECRPDHARLTGNVDGRGLSTRC